ncbi:hypothetical protein CP532_0414, partial [Ophiocordyceps camponoti-leonardi (nom. inval.)]
MPENLGHAGREDRATCVAHAASSRRSIIITCFSPPPPVAHLVQHPKPRAATAQGPEAQIRGRSTSFCIVAVVRRLAINSNSHREKMMRSA